MKVPPYNVLFFCPVGLAALRHLPKVVQRLSALNVTFKLPRHHAIGNAFADYIIGPIESLGKWQLAQRYLHPNECRDFDYLFIWDDDIEIGDFDPLEFLDFMTWNELKMAQPSIRSPFPLINPIAGQRRVGDWHSELSIVGRLTNFVGLSAPVFSREGWSEFYDHLDTSNRSGSGYEYIPISPKGIVDRMHVVATCQRNLTPNADTAELSYTLMRLGLFRYDAMTMGHLLFPTKELQRNSTPAPPVAFEYPSKSIIAIVGNATSAIDYSEMIDSADIVVRFNECGSLATHKLGSRTDILCIAASGVHSPKLASSITLREMLPRVPEIWSTCCAEDEAKETMRTLNDAFGTSRAFVRHLESHQLTNESSGFSATRALSASRNYIVDLYGFTWTGWEGHAWSLEKAQTLKWHEEERVSLHVTSTKTLRPNRRHLRVVPIYFNPSNALQWEALLSHWLDSYHASGNTLDVVIATDLGSRTPDDVQTIRIPDDPEFCDTPLHKAGWIKANAARLLAPCIIMDIDATIVGDIHWLESRTTRLGMCEDADNRFHEGWPEASPELNSGVLLVNDGAVFATFIATWRSRIEEFRHIPYFEELVWSAVWRRVAGELLPRVYNWSHWWGASERAVVVHRHGAEKWTSR